MTTAGKETEDSAEAPAVETAEATEDEEARTWRTMVPEGLQDFWSRVASGPQRCKGVRKDQNKDKKNDGVGKEIGLIYGGSLILNTIIGPGIFTSPKGVLDGAGSVGMSLVIWAICGFFSMMAALCFAELRESVRKDGVEYAYITEAFGPLAGFVYCWMRIAAAEPVGTAVFAVALADYTADSIYDDCGPPGMLRKSIAILAVVSLALLNVFSQKLADRMQILSMVGKTCAIGVIIFFGVKNVIDGKTQELKAGFSDTVTSPTRITFAFYNGLWAYGGWSNVNHVTSGLKKPPRNVPRLVKTIIPLVMLIYGLVVTSYFTVMSREDMLASEAIGVTWAERVLKGEAMAVIPIGVGLTALGSLNATFLSAGRLSSIASKDKQMPEVTSWVHVRSKTPILTVYTRLVISIIMILVAEIAELVRFFIFSVWLFHGMSVLALLVLRYKNKDKRRPYKVNLILPVIVVTVIAFLLIGPFLEEPQPEFISSIVLIVLSLLCYVPIHWIQSKATLPDKFVIWLQLFFRIAPKRDLRRKSILRRMSTALHRNSILIPAGASPATIRRLQGSPSLLRRVSMASFLPRYEGAGSPGPYRRSANSPNIMRQIQRHRSLAEADLKRGRSGSRVAWLETGEGGSPALIRRRPSRQAQSFGAADRPEKHFIPKRESMPNLQVVLNNELNKESSTDPIAYTNTNNTNSSNNTHKVFFSNTTSTAPASVTISSGLAPPPPAPPVPSSLVYTANNLPPPAIRRGSLTVNGPNGGPPTSSGGGVGVISTVGLPPGIRRGSLNLPALELGAYSGGGGDFGGGGGGGGGFYNRGGTRSNTNSPLVTARRSSSPGNATNVNSSLNAARRNYSTQSLPNNISHFVPSPIMEEDCPVFCPEDPPFSDDSRQGSEADLAVVGAFESDGGGEYEILTMPQLPLGGLTLDHSGASDSEDGDSSSSSSDDEAFRGLGFLFDSSTESSTSDTTTSLNEEGSVSENERGYYTSDEMDSDIDEVIFADIDDRTVSYI